MTTDPQAPKPSVPVTEVLPHHTAAAPAYRQSESLPEQRSSTTVIPLPVRSKRSRLPWLIGIAVVMAIGGGGMWYWWTSGTPPAPYKTALVDRGSITAIVTATGTVNPVISVQVGSQVSGKVSQLFADFNSKVTKGLVLAADRSKIVQGPLEPSTRCREERQGEPRQS